MRRWADAAVFFLPGAVLLSSPMAGGWANALAQAGCLAGLLFLLLRSADRLLPGGIPAGISPLGLLVGFALAQVLPLPSFLLEILSPLSAQWYGSSVWLTDPGVAMPLSVRPKSTLLAFFSLAAGGALYLLASSLLANRERLKRVAFVLCTLTVLAAFSSLAVLLVPAWTHMRPHIPFSFFSILLPLSMGLYLGERPETAFGTLRERLIEACLRPASHPHLMAGLAAMLAGTVLIFSVGPWRLGSVSGLLILAFLFLLRQGRRSNAVPLLAAALFILFGGIAVQGIQWESPLFIIPPSFPPLFGAGLEAGEMVPGAREGSVGGIAALVIEGGGTGVVLAGCFILAFFGKTVIAWRQRRRRFPIALGASALAASAVPILVAAVSPVAHDECTFLLFFLLAGMAAAATRSSSGLPNPGKVSTVRRYGVAAPVLLVLAGSILFQLGILSASALSAGGKSDPKTVHFDPFEEGYRIDLGRAALKEGKRETALEHFRAAVRLSPMAGESLQGVALSRNALGEKEAAGRLFEASLELGSGVREGYRLYIESLFAAKRLPEGKAAIRKAVEMNPAETTFYLDFLEKYGMTPGGVEAVLPRRFAVLSAYGDYLQRRGLTERAAGVYREALDCQGKETPDPEGVARIAAWFARSGNVEEALAAVQEGLRRSPGDLGLRRVAADCYEKSGITVRAAEERRALKLLGGK